MSYQETPYTYEQLGEMASFVRQKANNCQPTVGIIAGSGQATLCDLLEDALVIPYTDIKGFPQSTVAGHSGHFVIGKIGDKEVLVMSGRLHAYEGYPAWKVTAPVRVMHLLGIKTLVVTNAAGSLTQAHNIGDIIIIKDHIYLPGLCGNNPLVGPSEERFGPRFVDVSRVYTNSLRALAKEVSKELGIESLVKEGVYCMVTGPMYETPGEVRLLRMVGGDVVGMSTCPETIVAHHCGMKVLGITLVTDVCAAELNDETPITTHEEVLKVSQKRTVDTKRLIELFVKKLSL